MIFRWIILFNLKVKIMESQYTASRINRLSKVYQSNQLLTPFHEATAYKEIIGYLEKIQKQRILPEDFQKRISALQTDIRGILARQILVSSPTEPDHTTKYSSILKQKQMELLQQQLRNKTAKLKIEQMEKDFGLVNEELREFKIRCQQLEFDNQGFHMYRDFFNELSSLSRDRSRKSLTSIQSLMQDKILPKIDSFEKQLRSFEHSRDKSNLKAHVSQWGRQVNRLTNLQGLNAEILEKSLIGFYRGLENYRSYQTLKDQMRWRQQYEILKKNYDAFASIMKEKIEKLLPDENLIRQIKETFKRFDYESTRVEFHIVDQYVTSWSRRGQIVEVAHSQKETHQLISFLIVEFKHMIEKYPSLNNELSKKLLDIISYTQIDQLVKTSILDRLHSVISYHSDFVTVQNVYKVSMQEQRKLTMQLRILIKTLLQEIQYLQKQTRVKTRLDQDMFIKVKSQILEHAYIDDIISLYRPLPKTYEVTKFIDRNKFLMVQTTKPYIIRSEKACPIENTREKAVTITQQVQIDIEKVKILTETIQVPVRILQQKVVQVPIKYTENRTRLFEKITPQPYKQIENNYTYEKFVEVAKEVVKEYIYEDKFKQIQVPYQVIHQKLKDVITRQQILQIANTKQEVIKEVPVIVEKLVPVPEYHEVQKRIPYRVTQTVQKILHVEKPVYLNRVQEQILRVPQVVEKIVTRTIVQEKPIPIEVLKEVQTIVEIPKQHLVEVTHFIKGDREEILKEVEVFIEKPIIKQIILPVDKIIERNIPVYIIEEKPLILQQIHSHIEQQPKIIHLEVPKIVPIIEQIVKEVQVQVPVPVIIQKEIIKEVILEKEVIVEKIVEVPRVVEVEKIVEKIVIVPRIVEVIKQVDRFIEKLVPYQVPILQIVTIQHQKPVIETKKQIQIVEVIKERIQYLQKPYEVITEKIVPITKTVEILKEVQPEIVHVPVEVIKEYPIQVVKQRLVELIKEIHEVTVKDRQIQIPFRVQVAKELKRDIVVPVVKNIQTIVPVQQIRERIVQVRTQIPTTIQVTIEKQVPIQTIKIIEIEGPETIKYLTQLVQVEVCVQKAVPVYTIVQRPIEVPLKVDIIHPEIHQTGIPIDKPYIAEKTQVLQNPIPVHYMHYKQIPVQKQISKPLPYRDVIQVPQNVQTIVQKIVQINRSEQIERQVIREKLVSIVKQVAKVIRNDSPIYQTIYKPTQIPGEKEYIVTQKYIEVPAQVQRTAEKIVQKIIMMPQIVEVTKKIYELPENVIHAVERDHKQHYISLATQVNQGFLTLMEKLKNRSSPEQRKLIQMITKYQSLLEQWIKLPKIIAVKGQQAPTRPLIVPTEDKQKQSVLVHIIQQLLKQLRRLNKKGEKLQLDQKVKELFFSSLNLDLPSIDEHYHEYYSDLSRKFNSFGQWATDHLLIVNSFLEQKLVLSHQIGSSNLARQQLSYKTNDLRLQIEQKNKKIKELQAALDRAFEGIQNETQIVDMRSRSRLLEDIKKTMFTISDSRYSQQHRFSFRGPRVVQSLIVGQQSRYRTQNSSLISKLNNIEKQRSMLLNRIAEFQRQLELTRGDGKIRTILNENQYKRTIQNLELQNRKLRSEIQSLKERDLDSRVTCGHDRIIEHLQNENRRLMEENARLLQQQRVSRTSQRGGQNISNVQLQNTKRNMKEQFDKKIEKIRKDHQQEMKQLKSKTTKQEHNLQFERIARQRDELQLQNIQLRKIIEQSREGIEETFRGVKKTTGGKTQEKVYPPSQIQGYKTPKTSFQQKKVQKLPKSSRVEEEQVTQERYMRGDEQIRSTSSRQSRPVTESSFRSTMSLNMFMQYDPEDIYIKAVMNKIIEGYQEQIKKQQYHTFTPKNIKLLRFHKDKLNEMAVQFQVPNLRKDNRVDGCYLAPQILNGAPLSEKAIVFSLGIIWDELIHHSLYFKSLEQLRNPNIQYELRSQNFSPIIKNLLVDMLQKDPQKRIGLEQVKRRFLLEQKIKRS